MIKKILIAIPVLLILGVIFMPNITTYSAKKAFEKENVNKPWAPETAYRAAGINLKFWRYATAIQMYEKSMATFPDYKEYNDASYRLALCYEKTDQLSKAIAQYESFMQKYPNHRWNSQAAKRIANIKANQL
ncbi:MAG: tetratricopeptide repeat protein [Verrucomicrobiota bacterium]|nr:tetratricopeptide repeat protein [Verrucomicrobiota bacterium]